MCLVNIKLFYRCLQRCRRYSQEYTVWALSESLTVLYFSLLADRNLALLQFAKNLTFSLFLLHYLCLTAFRYISLFRYSKRSVVKSRIRKVKIAFYWSFVSLLIVFLCRIRWAYLAHWCVLFHITHFLHLIHPELVHELEFYARLYIPIHGNSNPSFGSFHISVCVLPVNLQVTTLSVFSWSKIPFQVDYSHRDRSIHIERECFWAVWVKWKKTRLGFISMIGWVTADFVLYLHVRSYLVIITLVLNCSVELKHKHGFFKITCHLALLFSAIFFQQSRSTLSLSLSVYFDLYDFYARLPNAVSQFRQPIPILLDLPIVVREFRPLIPISKIGKVV